MPNMPDVGNRILGVQVTRELYHALAQEAAARKMMLSQFVRFILNEEILRLNTVLTDENKKKIQEEIKNAIKSRHS